MKEENRSPGDSWRGLPAWGLAAFAAAMAFYVASVCSPFAFDLRYSLYLDTTNVYWLQTFADRSVLRGDELVDLYFEPLRTFFTDFAWIWLTSLFTWTVPYTKGLKVLAILASVAATLMVRRIALLAAAGRAAAVVPVLFVPMFLSMESFFGVPRVYGALLLLGFAWAAEAGRFWLAPLLASLCFIFYPAASAGLWAACLLLPWFFKAEFSAPGAWRVYRRALAAGAALLLLLFSRSGLAKYADLSLGRLAQFESAKFYNMVSGRLSSFNPLDALGYFALNLNDHTRLYVIFFLLLLLVCGLGLLVSPRRPALMPRSVLCLLAGCGAAFAAIYPVHEVSAARQMVVIVPLALVFWAGESLLELAGGKRRAALASAFFSALFVFLHPVFGETLSMRHYADVYDFLAARPAGEISAGYPDSWLMYTVPVFASRPVALWDRTFDQQMLFVRGPEEFFARRKALLQALYCAAPGAKERLAAEYNISWLFIEKKYYEPEFLSGVAGSASPNGKSSAAVIAGAPAPEACYRSLAAAAAFSGKNSQTEGVAVPLKDFGKAPGPR